MRLFKLGHLLIKLSKNARSEMIGRFFLLKNVRLCLFLFVIVSSQSTFGVEYACSAKSELRWETLGHVIDGDTIRLANGEKLRIIAINTPELGDKNQPAQALSRQAKAAAIKFFGPSKKVGIQAGVDPRDRYGRLLAHVYRYDGASLAEYLLTEGLAVQIVVPPNNSRWHCLARAEVLARQKGVGIWGHPLYRRKIAADLALKDSGFQLIQGVVKSVTRSGDGWWLQVGKLAVRLRDKDMRFFSAAMPGVKPVDWRGQKIQLRGWVINRSDSTSVKKKGYPALMMNLRHPAMMN